jgi:hypothetical protein
MTSLTVRYAVDESLRAAANARGLNYWHAYVAEVLDRLGACAQPCRLADCADPALLAQTGVLLLGDFPEAALPPGAAAALAAWVRRGGVLIGFVTAGLDSLFGVADEGLIAQGDDPFGISGYLAFQESVLTGGCRAPIEPEQKLIIISPIRRLRLVQAEELARLFLCDPDQPGDGRLAADSGRAAISGRRLGRGYAGYFAFNLSQTLWALQQGRPIDRDYDGDGYLRVSDACVIGQNSRAVPYADAFHFLLANLVGLRPVPCLYPIPALGGRVAPGLLFFGGDDEGDPQNQVIASDFMAARGLPYHLNIMPRDGRFAIGAAEQARIEANGHEVALHYNFMDGFRHPSGFTREDVLAQARLFREVFGKASVCSVAHWCRWVGWAEPARWMREAGGIAENHRIHWTSPPLNPVNCVGFAFGSAFPRHYWDDAAHGNARVDFLSLPIVAYEVGYQGDQVCLETTRAAFDLAMRYHLTLNYFYHPVYVAQFPACRQANDHLAGLIRGLPVPPVLMGPDRLARWWLARSRAVIEGASRGRGAISFTAECAWEDGFVVRVPTGPAAARSCRVDGRPAAVEDRLDFGQHWAHVALAPGRHEVRLRR